MLSIIHKYGSQGLSEPEGFDVFYPFKVSP
jgi:hypothetical protein